MSQQRTRSVQQKKHLHRGRNKVLYAAAAMCVLCAPILGQAGTDLGAAARTLAANPPRTVRAHSMTLSLKAPPAVAMNVHRQSLALNAPRHDVVGRASTVQLATTGTPSNIAFPISWEKKTEIERTVRSLKHNGLPLVHLWGTGRNLLAIGVSPRGVPGIYFTQTVPD
jgi:hypothetical protein